ncbi:hypothetical protein BD769DRAFT_1688600 [Suillus cothurnatus]|nr:hypothetical protein BD769DRAFT_1688600 [Suillus cothurnatus]
MILSEECDINEFDQYMMNNIPIPLVRLIDITFVERNEPSDTVRYAILSHRWLNQGKLTYERIKAGTAAGPGYDKLEKFWVKAEEYNMKFAWTQWRDEWTERGWTLQKLIAPARMEFFNKYWAPMMGDDKDDTNEFLISRSLLSSLRHREPAEILETLERATGIPYDDLRRTFCPSLSEIAYGEGEVIMQAGDLFVPPQLEGRGCEASHFARQS